MSDGYEVILFGMRYERLRALAAKVVADWRAHNDLAAGPPCEGEPPRQEVKWNSLHALAEALPELSPIDDDL